MATFAPYSISLVGIVLTVAILNGTTLCQRSSLQDVLEEQIRMLANGTVEDGSEVDTLPTIVSLSHSTISQTTKNELPHESGSTQGSNNICSCPSSTSLTTEPDSIEYASTNKVTEDVDPTEATPLRKAKKPKKSKSQKVVVIKFPDDSDPIVDSAVDTDEQLESQPVTSSPNDTQSSDKTTESSPELLEETVPEEVDGEKMSNRESGKSKNERKSGKKAKQDKGKSRRSKRETDREKSIKKSKRSLKSRGKRNKNKK